ncbi:MAG TPA: DUF2382 domain-containing protein [Solirubrobacteraceae bacterium]|nr:DUF2382 domain-containing protein [Solirubrobacteraceae bacterium]
MAPLDIDTALGWRGRTIVDRDGDKIGKLDELYLDEADRPAWGAVTTGLFGRRQSFVPLADLRPAGDDLQVPYEKDRVKDAPNVDPDEQLSGEEEARLHRHYGVADEPERADESERVAEPQRADEPERADHPEAAEGGGAEARREGGGDVDRAPARAGGDDAGAEMIRSEEEVDVSTRRRVAGRARLKKYVVTEHVKKVVPVQREEVRVEFEPGDEEEAAPDAARGEAAEEQRARTERA